MAQVGMSGGWGGDEFGAGHLLLIVGRFGSGNSSYFCNAVLSASPSCQVTGVSAIVFSTSTGIIIGARAYPNGFQWDFVVMRHQ